MTNFKVINQSGVIGNPLDLGWIEISLGAIYVFTMSVFLWITFKYASLGGSKK